MTESLIDMCAVNNTEGHGVLALNYPPAFADGLDDQSGRMILKSLLEASTTVRVRLAFLSQQCVSVQCLVDAMSVCNFHGSLPIARVTEQRLFVFL